MKSWYAVYTRPRCEKKVADYFSKRKMEAYCPSRKLARPWLGRKAPAEALFQGYVFVRLLESELPQVRRIEGVINFVYWLGKPVVVRDIEIEMLKRFLDVHEEVEVEKTAVHMGAMVTLTEAPPTVFQKQDINVVTVAASGAKLLLPSLGYRLCSSIQNQTHTVSLALDGLPKQQDALRQNQLTQ